MASVSISAYRGQDYAPDALVLGTSAPTTYDIAIQINKIPANSATLWTKQEVVIFLQRAIELVEDGRYVDLASV